MILDDIIIPKKFFKKIGIGATNRILFAIYRVKGGFAYGRQEDNRAFLGAG